MGSNNSFTLFKRPIVVGATVFLALLGLTQFVTYQHYLLFKSARAREIKNAVDIAQDRLQTALSNSLSATQTLSFIVKKYGKPDDFDTIAKRILESNRFIDAIELEEGGTIVKVYPLKGNEAVVGYNVLADTVARIEAYKAIEKRQLFFAGPLNLKQGGVGIVGRLPIFIDNKFWGFSIALIKLSTFLQAAEMDSVSSGPYIYQLSKVNPHTGKEEFFLPHPELFKNETAVSVYVPDGEWKLYALPKESEAFVSVIPLLLLGFLLSATGGVFAFFITRQPFELKKLVDEKSAQLQKTQENYRVTLERVSDAFVAIDSDWRFTYVNPKAGEIFSCNPEKLIGKNIWTEFPDLTDTLFCKACYSALQTQKYIYLEAFSRAYNLWFENNIYPSANGLSIFFKDISERRKIDLALKQSEQRYRQLIEEIPEAVYTCDEDGYIVLFNRAAERLWGRKPEPGKDKWGGGAKLFLKDGVVVEHQNSPLAMALKEGKARLGEEEVIIERYDGTRRNVLSHHSLLYDANRKITGAVNILVDITARRAAEGQAEIEKNYSDSIINSLPGVFYLFTKEGVYLRWNRNLELVSGYTAEEVKKMHPLDFFVGDEKELIAQKISEVFATGFTEVEATLITKEGKRIPYFFNGHFGNFEGVDCLIGMGIDITERKKAEEEIVKSEKRFRNILDNMLEGVQIFDANWRCMYANDAVALQGPYTKEETIGRTLMENYPGIEDSSLFKIFQECRDLGISKHIEHDFTFPDKSTSWFELSIQPNPEGLFVLSVDITERRKAEDAIQASEKKFRYLFNNNPAIIFVWDIETLKLLEVNETGLREFGFNYDEAINMSLLDFRLKEEHDEIRESVKRIANQIEVTSKGTWKHVRRDGQLVYMDVSTHRINYNNSKAMLSVAENVTLKMQMEEQIKKSYDDIRLLNSHLETIREDERAFIAREIHDQLGQQLTALKMDASWISKKVAINDKQATDRLSSMVLLIDETVKTVRRIASDLRPGILDDLGLMAALEWQSTEFEKRTGIKLAFNTTVTDIDPGKKCSTDIFRVYQEILTNIARHAHATQIETNITVSSSIFYLSVKDNGLGFNVSLIKAKNTLGLIGMNERIAMLKGELNIDSSPGKGTEISIKIHIHKNA